LDPDSYLCRLAELFDGVTVYPPSLGAIIAISLAVLLLFASGFVSASEIAFFSLSPSDLSEIEEEEHSSDKRIMALLKDSEKLLATILISNNFVNVTMTGREIRQAFEYLFSLKSDGSVMNGTFQYSRGFHLIADLERYREQGCRMEYIGLNGEEIDDERLYTVGMTKNCLNKFKRYFGFAVPEEKASLVAISTFSDLTRWMITQNEPISVHAKGRFEMRHTEYLEKA
jgi:hypothetical protein